MKFRIFTYDIPIIGTSAGRHRDTQVVIFNHVFGFSFVASLRVPVCEFAGALFSVVSGNRSMNLYFRGQGAMDRALVCDLQQSLQLIFG
jgi:hypothetical protein